MSTEKKLLIFLVDDDELFLKTLEIEIASVEGYTSQSFTTGELCLKNISQNPDFVVLDYHLDDIEKNAINGLETLDKIRAYNPLIPVIMLSSQDKIDVAVNCMKHKALDYIVKSETAFIRLQKTIITHLHYQNVEKILKWYMDKI